MDEQKMKEQGVENSVETPGETISTDVVLEPVKTEQTEVVKEEEKEVGGKFGLSGYNDKITKSEGFLMFVAIILITVLCDISISKSITQMSFNNNETIHSMKQQITSLSSQIEALEDELVEKEKLNLNIDVNGEKITLSYDPVTGEVTQQGSEVNEGAEAIPNETFDERPFLGVGFDETQGTNALGIKVAYVYQSSPAEFAGMKVGDIITTLNGQKVTTFDELSAIIDAMKAGDPINIDVITIEDGAVTPKTLETSLTYRGNFDLGDDTESVATDETTDTEDNKTETEE